MEMKKLTVRKLKKPVIDKKKVRKVRVRKVEGVKVKKVKSVKLDKKKGEKRKVRRIRFGTYPYTVTRVRVMKSKLLRAKDYLRMKKMGLNEMIRFLEESEYKGEIDSLSKEYRGMELTELALNENLANVVNKLLRISLKKEVKLLIEFYSLKWILNNVKLVLRTRMNQLGEDDLKYGIIPIEPTSYEKCFRMYRESEEKFIETVNEIVNINTERFRELYRKNDLVRLENKIDRNFYSQMIELKKKIQLRRGDPLKQFFDHLVYLVNIKNVIRFKREEIEKERIREMVVMEKDKKKDRFIKGLIESEDLKTLFKRLKRSRYRSLVTPEVEEDVSKLEGSINSFLLLHASRLLHRKPLSVSPIFGYLLTKEIEIQNIRVLMHSKAMKLGEDFVDSNIIVPEESLLKVIKGA